MPDEPNAQRCDYRRAEDDPERSSGQIAAGRAFGELGRDEFEMAFEQGEIGSRLIRLAQL
jgi:hypothetical protein